MIGYMESNKNNSKWKDILMDGEILQIENIFNGSHNKKNNGLIIFKIKDKLGNVNKLTFVSKSADMSIQVEKAERLIKKGSYYRHFKGNYYKVLYIAENSEDKEKVVVYQAMYGEKKVYVRPFKMFISKVDHCKYPEIEQEYRFMSISELENQFGTSVVASWNMQNIYVDHTI
ncbi:hypothetical protein CLACE_29160 [Clostridium acetobutylicum]|nr:hypothetical protein CLACE_29160 [Clostridium acetobutylicum]OOM01734.1 hypothetical protein CLABU_38420 [Clostridium acetobutylicum]